jgi:hypothetical protein
MLVECLNVGVLFKRKDWFAPSYEEYFRRVEKLLVLTKKNKQPKIHVE